MRQPGRKLGALPGHAVLCVCSAGTEQADTEQNGVADVHSLGFIEASVSDNVNDLVRRLIIWDKIRPLALLSHAKCGKNHQNP